jgi:ABC-type antimicrobial peptide transport system permease subunit
LRTSLLPVVAGIVVGLVAAWWSGRFLQSLLDVGQAHDPLMMSLAALTLVLTGAVAAWRPARRAASMDPVTTLRVQ